MALLIPPNVMKQLAAMPRPQAQRLLDRLDAIAAAPQERHQSVVALTGTSGTYRLRQGDWRAVFSVEDGDVIVDRVAHRREVYR